MYGQIMVSRRLHRVGGDGVETEHHGSVAVSDCRLAVGFDGGAVAAAARGDDAGNAVGEQSW